MIDVEPEQVPKETEETPEEEFPFVPELDDNELIGPILKYVGSKRDLVEDIAMRMPSEIKYYIEPFVGSGAAFFYLYRTGRFAKTKQIVLSDFDRHLMEIYEDIRRDPKGLHEALEETHATYRKAPKTAYYLLRDKWNRKDYSSTANIILRYAAFNGLWRENKSGEMNTPWGKKAKLALPSLERLQAVSGALQKVDLDLGDFYDVIESCEFAKGPGGTLSVDPPYLKGWVDYSKNGFSLARHVQLVKICKDWADSGAFVMYHNSDCKATRELLAEFWPDANIETVYVKRRINSKGDGREPVPEVLVTPAKKESKE